MKISLIDNEILTNTAIRKSNDFDKHLADTSDNSDEISLNKIHLSREHGDPQQVVYLFKKYEKATRSINKSLKTKKICFKEWRILNEIVLSNKASPKIISAQTNLTNSQISHYLNLLESKELILRKHTEQYDRRTVQINITELGEDTWSFGIRCIAKLEI